MRNRDGKLNVSHALAAHTRYSDFYATTVADDTLVFDALVFTAGTFVVANGSENTLAKQTAGFGLKSPIINGLGIFDLTT